jgi:hypothetical protein
MTQFQLVSLIVFLFVAIGAYKNELLTLIRGVLSRRPGVPVTPPPPGPAAINFVQDMLTVADLRDRLAVAGCQDGVDACTVLLRVMIDYKSTKGAL